MARCKSPTRSMVWRSLMHAIMATPRAFRPSASYAGGAMILIPNIVLANASHSRAIAEMSREHIEYGLGWSWTQSRVLKAIQDEATNVAVILDGGAVLGFGIMRYGEQKAHLVLLAVAPQYRKQGLGAL